MADCVSVSLLCQHNLHSLSSLPPSPPSSFSPFPPPSSFPPLLPTPLLLHQPYCDGSHKVTKLRPVKFSVKEQNLEAFLCGCKQTGSQPYCDGTHATAQVQESTNWLVGTFPAAQVVSDVWSGAHSFKAGLYITMVQLNCELWAFHERVAVSVKVILAALYDILGPQCRPCIQGYRRHHGGIRSMTSCDAVGMGNGYARLTYMYLALSFYVLYCHDHQVLCCNWSVECGETANSYLILLLL